MAGEREYGDLAARLAHAEAEIIKLRDRSHRHSNAITSAGLLVGVVSDCKDRIEALEAFRGRLAPLLGAVSGFSAIVGGIAATLVRHWLQ